LDLMILEVFSNLWFHDSNKTTWNVLQIKMYPSIPEKKNLINDVMNPVESQWHGEYELKNDIIQALARVLKQSNKQKYFPQTMNH